MSEAETEKRSRRERRAEAKGSKPDEIKDRNQRLRAEAIARRKSERKQELSAARAEGLGTAERVDDALVRGADGASRLLRDNFKWMQWVIVLGLAGSMAYLVYDYRRGVDSEARGHELSEALAATHGRIASATPVTPSDRNLVDTRPEFESAEKKLAAALGHFTDLSKSSEPELKLLGQLGRGGVLYDQEKFADARAAYEEVFRSPLSAQFPELRVRAAEGVALCHEAEGRLPDAAKSVGVLAELGGQASDLALLHGARIAYQLGEVEKAKADLVKLLEKVEKKRAKDALPGYIEAAAKELQKTVDPTRAAAAAAATGGISPEQLEALKRQFEAMQSSAPAPAAPAPMDAPPVGLPGSELDDPIDVAPAPAAPSTPPTPATTPAPTKAPVQATKKPAPAPPAPAPAPVAPAPVAPAPAPATAAPEGPTE